MTLSISTADPLQVYLVSGDGSLIQPALGSGDSIDFGEAVVDYWGTGLVPVIRIAVKNNSNTPEQVTVTGGHRDGIIPVFGATTDSLEQAPDNRFILQKSGDAGDAFIGWIGLSFAGSPFSASPQQPTPGAKSTTIVFRANDMPTGPALIAYSGRQFSGGILHIYTIKPDGTDVLELTSGNLTDDYPAWSPNGAKIAFMSDRDGSGFQKLHVLDMVSGTVTKVSTANENHFWQSWSPDSSRIASGACSHCQIWVTEADGSGESKKSTGYLDWHPDWFPVGSSFVLPSTAPVLGTRSTAAVTPAASDGPSARDSRPRESGRQQVSEKEPQSAEASPAPNQPRERTRRLAAEEKPASAEAPPEPFRPSNRNRQREGR